MKVRIVACLILVLAILLPFPAAAATEACVGYPEARTYITESAYWQSTGETRNREVELGACFPNDGVVVRGAIDFDIHVTIEDQPAGARFTRVRIADNSTTKWSKTSGLPALVNGEADVWIPVRLSLSGWSTGRHELRFGAYVIQPDGSEQFVTGGWQLCVVSCTPERVRTGPFTEGRSWYVPGTQYTNARIRSRLPLTGSTVAECAAPSGTPITRCVVRINGVAVKDVAGAWKGTVAVPAGGLLRVESYSRVSSGTATGVVEVERP